MHSMTYGIGVSFSHKESFTVSHRRIYAVLPAAGRSRRMGRPKLLLPLGGSTVIARLVGALRAGGVDDVIVVVRPDDTTLQEAAEAAGAQVVCPENDPADMRQSVQYALDYLAAERHPNADDGWMLIPADHPLVDAKIVESLLASWRAGAAPILIPTHEGRRGHPTLFRWELSDEVPRIPPHQGLNRLVHDHESHVQEFPVPSDHILLDLDTLEDYERLQVEWRRENE